MSANEEYMGYPTVIYKGKRVKTPSGMVVSPASTIQPASAALHKRTGSMGESQEEYATVCPTLYDTPEVSQPAQTDFSTKTPRHAEIHLSVQALMPKTFFGLFPADLAHPAPEEEYVSRNIDPMRKISAAPVKHTEE